VTADRRTTAVPSVKHSRSLRPKARRNGFNGFARVACLAVLVAFVLALTMHASADVGDREWAQQTSAAIDAAERRLATLDRSATPREDLGSVRETATRVRTESDACLAATTARQDALAGRLQALGEASPTESAEVQATRQALESESAQLEARESTCRLLRLRAQELADAAAASAQALMTARLLERGPHLGLVLAEMLTDPLAQFQNVAERVGLPSIDWGLPHIAVLVILLAAGTLAGRFCARLIRPSRAPEVADCVSGGATALRAAAAHMLPALLTVLAVSGYLAWLTEPASPIARAGFAVLAWLLTLTLIRMTLRPPPPARPFLPWSDALLRSLNIRATVLSVLLLVGYLAFALIPWPGDSDTILLFLRSVYGAVLVVNLIWILTLTGSFLQGAVWTLLRAIAGALLVIALFAEWLGYHTLAPYLLRGVAGTVLALILGALVARFFADLFDGLDQGRLCWQQRVRARLRLTDGDPLPGLTWLRVVITLLVWGVGIYFVLLSWGLSAEGAAMVRGWVTEGFAIGDVRLVPSQILIALLVFAVFTTLVRWMRQSVLPGWLGRTRLDAGAREAVIAIGGYAGMGVAIVVALSMAGIGFQNLAIVVGALSVGIGFGL